MPSASSCSSNSSSECTWATSSTRAATPWWPWLPASLARRSPSASISRTPADLARSRNRSEEHTSELQSPCNLVCRLLLEKKPPMDSRGLARVMALELFTLDPRRRDALTERDLHPYMHDTGANPYDRDLARYVREAISSVF